MMKRYLLIIIGLLLLILGMGFYFHNKSSAQARVKDIIVKDQAGQDTSAEISSLKAYIAHHMHSSESFKLDGAYQRAVTAAQTPQTPTVNSEVYAQAQAACASKADSITQANCVINYVNSHSQPTSTPQQPAPLPDASSYTFVLIAPKWTFDLAGILLILGLICIVIGLITSRKKPHSQAPLPTEPQPPYLQTPQPPL